MLKRLISVALAISAGTVGATSLNLSNTGLNGAGNLYSTGGQIDANFTVVSAPDSVSGAAATVSTINNYYHVAGRIGTTTADWISPLNIAGASDQTRGLYVYQESFVVADPGLYTFTGKWGVDNCGQILLNSVAVAGTGTAISSTSPSCNGNNNNFGTPTSFSFAANLAAGTNQLQFAVYNIDGPTALFVDQLAASSAPVPEPSGRGLLAAGLAVLLFVHRRKARAKSQMR